MERSLERWIEDAPRIESDSDTLKATYRRSLVDLAALRFTPPVIGGGKTLPAAGLPWSRPCSAATASSRASRLWPFTPELAATTLRALGNWQGSRIDDFRDEDPGRILHEMRQGADGVRGASALAVLRLRRRHAAVRCPAGRVRALDGRPTDRASLEATARAALNWIDGADLMGNGYISYKRRNEETGLENQCWKDSWDSISYSDGRLRVSRGRRVSSRGIPTTRRCAAPAWPASPGRIFEFADELERQAADLKRRFNRDFWVEDRGYFAIALDSDGKQVDSLASNNGHLLWSGIVEKTKAKSVVGHLMGPRLFRLGVRTLAEVKDATTRSATTSERSGSFDCSFIAWGLRSYGFKEEAAQIAGGILDAAEFFAGRLPEAFGGYQRGVTKYPVRCPTACSPQAWSTGAPLLMLRTMLGLEPIGDHLVVDPAFPESIGLLALLDIPGRWAGSMPARGEAVAPPARRRARAGV